ncbi:MAG: tRNA 2-thiocytidine(32) synthetase TtcA [Gammaproteobacteria bacterium]|nr:tRNA 2-thiocytidine(32) synthetase TtcA [Gammaproteobacteria bacterium]
MNAEKLERKLLNYMGKAIADYNMIQRGDRILVCLSGGKDSYTLLTLLNKLRLRSRQRFEIFSYTLDQGQPGWNDGAMRAWLQASGIPHVIETRDTYSVVIDKVPEGKTYCSLCSRLRRGNIYRFATEHGFNKIALGHHRDDLIQSLLMSILYSGEIRSMPPKLLTDTKRHIVIRPLAYCQERDIQAYAQTRDFPLIPCNLCGSQENMTRRKIKRLIHDLAGDNPKIPSNILNALGNLQVSQLMDRSLWNFRELESLMEHDAGMVPAQHPEDSSQALW